MEMEPASASGATDEPHPSVLVRVVRVAQVLVTRKRRQKPPQSAEDADAPPPSESDQDLAATSSNSDAEGPYAATPIEFLDGLMPYRPDLERDCRADRNGSGATFKNLTMTGNGKMVLGVSVSKQTSSSVATMLKGMVYSGCRHRGQQGEMVVGAEFLGGARGQAAAGTFEDSHMEADGDMYVGIIIR
jgi:hypothetical protein